MELILYMEGVSTPPYIGGALGGTVGSDFPPNLPLRGVGGRIGGSVGASLKSFRGTLENASERSSGILKMSLSWNFKGVLKYVTKDLLRPCFQQHFQKYLK